MQNEAFRHAECPVRRKRIRLKREGDAAARHAKVIVGAIHHIPAEITHPADVWSKTNLQPGANLAKTSGFAVGVSSRKTNRNRLGRS